MKKITKAMFLLSVMVAPFVFSACEKDEGTTDYNNVSDDDWKKALAVNDYCGNDLNTVCFFC